MDAGDVGASDGQSRGEDNAALHGDDVTPTLFGAVAGTGEVQDALTDGVEALLDEVAGNELVKAIPVIGTMVGLVQGVRSVRDWWWTRKLAAIVFAIDPPSPEDAERWRDRFASDPDRTENGERLIAVIDNATSRFKAVQVARVFVRYLDGECDGATFRRVADMIDKAHADDLRQLVEGGPESLSSDATARLVQVGLITGGHEPLLEDDFLPLAATPDGLLVL